MTPFQRKQIAQEALAAALQIRQKKKLPYTEPISAYELAEELRVEVKFVDIPSLEEVYFNSTRPRIYISSHRPSGRQVYSCAHGVAHHVFGDGTRLHEFIERRSRAEASDPIEFRAQCFAGFLLMPRPAVLQAFESRGLLPGNCSPADLYAIAGFFGVGYTSLVYHLQVGLKILTSVQADALSKCRLSDIKRCLVGQPVMEDVFVVDTHWIGRPIDVQVGDRICVPDGFSSDGNVLESMTDLQNSRLFRASRPGVGRVSDPITGWTNYVRVRRRSYIGFATYRHMEDPDFE